MSEELVGRCVSDALEVYVAGLRGVLDDGLAGVYLYGSVAWGAYNPSVSDVDVAVRRRPVPFRHVEGAATRARGAT